ncbi:hypothetical protein J2R76_003445 [Bradyrhizobium sp. USDA 4532]|nr:hypothetical protein [Bradyrhizobium sp. USDA 4545]MCP1919854.1 hypothetical protein [Bradyrhizobium sp. USDA 4532]
MPVLEYVNRYEEPSLRTGGHHSWKTAECEQFEKCHAVGTRARLAYELLLQVGQPRCDVVRMGRQHIRGGMMAMGRKKTGGAVQSRSHATRSGGDRRNAGE